jgi:hypothetical protein
MGRARHPQPFIACKAGLLRSHAPRPGTTAAAACVPSIPGVLTGQPEGSSQMKRLAMERNAAPTRVHIILLERLVGEHHADGALRLLPCTTAHDLYTSAGEAGVGAHRTSWQTDAAARVERRQQRWRRAGSGPPVRQQMSHARTAPASLNNNQPPCPPSLHDRHHTNQDCTAQLQGKAHPAWSSPRAARRRRCRRPPAGAAGRRRAPPRCGRSWASRRS